MVPFYFYLLRAVDRRKRKTGWKKKIALLWAAVDFVFQELRERGRDICIKTVRRGGKVSVKEFLKRVSGVIRKRARDVARSEGVLVSHSGGCAAGGGHNEPDKISALAHDRAAGRACLREDRTADGEDVRSSLAEGKDIFYRND